MGARAVWSASGVGGYVQGVDGRRGCQSGGDGRTFGVAGVDTGIGGQWRWSSWA